MSRSSLKALGIVTAAALVATLSGASPAPAREAAPAPVAAVQPDPVPATIMVQAKSSKPKHYNSSVKVDVPGGGSAQVGSPSLDNTMTKTTVTVSAPLSDQPGFAKMAMTMFQLPTPGRRLAACVTLTPKYLDSVVDQANESIDDLIADESRKAIAFLLYCIRLAQLVSTVIDEANVRVASTASTASTACPALPLGVKVKTKRVNGRYVVSTNGPLTSKKKNSRLKVTCQATGTKYVYSVQPRKKGVSLKSVVGPNLYVGIASPPGAEGAQVKVAFKAP